MGLLECSTVLYCHPVQRPDTSISDLPEWTLLCCWELDIFCSTSWIKVSRQIKVPNMNITVTKFLDGTYRGVILHLVVSRSKPAGLLSLFLRGLVPQDMQEVTGYSCFLAINRLSVSAITKDPFECLCD